MSTGRIGGGNRPPKDEAARPTEEAQGAKSQQGVDVEAFVAKAKEQKVPQAIVDKFVSKAPQFDKQLQNIAPKVLAGRLHFSSEDLAQIAAQFAAVLQKYPRADRKERARLFARAVLKRKRIAKLFENADENAVEAMFENIAEQLDGLPVFAQLVDEVTEGARKINLG